MHNGFAGLLHEALYGDLELRRLLVQVDRDREKRGTQQSRVIIDENSTPDNTHPLEERR
jgi:hypothetical protein